MPNNRIAILYNGAGEPVDAWSWDDQYSWGGPPGSSEDLEPGDRLEYYSRRLSKSEIAAQRKAAEDKIVQDRLEAARQLLRANGELPDPNQPAVPPVKDETLPPF